MVAATQQYKRKLRGWLSYAFASEVFVIVSLTLFLPICLEQFARDNGYLWPDKIEPCSPKVPISNSGNSTSPVIPTGRCVVKLGWGWIDTASFSLYVYSISVALQALTVISMGGIADHPPHRKRLLLTFAFLGSLSATLFLLLPSSSPFWILCAPLSILANVGFGASVVAMNAYLPGLAKESPEVRAILEEIEGVKQSGGVVDEEREHNDEVRESTESDDANPSSPLLPPSPSHPSLPPPDQDLANLTAQYNKTLSTRTSAISSQGIAAGYFAGIFLLIVALIPVTLLHGSTFALRLAIGISGIWWAVWTIPAAVWIPSSEGGGAAGREEVGEGEVEEFGVGLEKPWNIRRDIISAWSRLFTTLHPSEIQKLKNTFKYLAAWFLLSDGFTTITSTALLFGNSSVSSRR